jgi:hypothetical protein
MAPAGGVVSGGSVLIWLLELFHPGGVKWSPWAFVTKKKSLTRTNATRRAYIKGAIVGQVFPDARQFERGTLKIMATYRDPVRCFAPLEVIERVLEIRAEAGYAPAIYLLSPDDLADYLDAFGFDVYAFSKAEAEFHFGDYRAPLAPGGDHAHNSLTAH